MRPECRRNLGYRIRERRSASYRYVVDRDAKNRDVEYDLVRSRSRPLPKGPGPGYWNLFYLGDDLLVAWTPTPPKGAAAKGPDSKAAAGTSSSIVPSRYYFWDRATGRLRKYEGPSIVGQSPSGRFVVARTGSREEDAPTWLVDRGRR
ncbi:hypothetical protein EON77_05790 [bacterium]|nr:MAG: hypothetical protein EON77_05790 [bacterium]